MNGKRSRLEMYLDVLERIEQGISKPTNIMYKCNLSWRPLREILELLIEKGLVEETIRENHRRYTITRKGNIYLGTLIRMLHPVEDKAVPVSNGRNGLILTLQGLKSGLHLNTQEENEGKE